MNILDKIIVDKKLEVSLARKEKPLPQLLDSEYFQRQTFSLKDRLKMKPGIIAEFKRKSPSQGEIHPVLKSEKVVLDYQNFGAAGISILTDEKYFGGNNQDILAVRNQIKIPILRKDFMVDEYQFYQAKALGADVVLLIASCLSPAQILEFTDLAHDLGLEVLLEIHTEEELNHFNKNIDMVGINNRNLKNFEVDIQHSIHLKNTLPKDVLTIAESAISSVSDFKILKENGFDGFLMGTYFMKHQNPGKAFLEFMNQIKELDNHFE